MSRNSFDYLMWRGRALYNSLNRINPEIGGACLEEAKVKKEIASIEKKLKRIAKKELKKKGIID